MSTARINTVIVGGGQAGLAISYYLRQQGREHVVLERAPAVADAWRNQRWDSFTLVTPNFQVRMPGAQYAGDDCRSRKTPCGSRPPTNAGFDPAREGKKLIGSSRSSSKDCNRSSAKIIAAILWKRSSRETEKRSCSRRVPAPPRPRLRRSAFVSMMQATNLRNRYDATRRRLLHFPVRRRVLLQRQVRAAFVIIGQERF